MQVNLHGRTQRQREDDLWYTCIAHVRVIGTPIYNYVPQHVASHPISRQPTDENMLEVNTQSLPTADEGVDMDCAQSAAGDDQLCPFLPPCIVAPSFSQSNLADSQTVRLRHPSCCHGRVCPGGRQEGGGECAPMRH